jgi:hypothetical protein
MIGIPSLTGLIPAPYRILAIVLLIGACIGFGFVKGISRESDRNDAQQLKQKQADEQAFNRALVNGKQHAIAVIEWQTAARDYYHNWQEALANEKDIQLASCIQQTGQAGFDVRLSGTWVGLYNAAWQPKLDQQGDPGGTSYSLGQAGSAAFDTSVSPREVLDNTRINAELCGADRKRLDELIDHIQETQQP